MTAIRFAGIGDEAGERLEEQVGALARLGWRAIELRTVDGTAVADLDDQQFTRLVRTLEASGLETCGVASRIGNWARPITGDFAQDLDELRVLADRCRLLGTRRVRVMSWTNDGLPEEEWGRRALRRMRRLADVAEQAGLVLLHENCTGWAGRDPVRMLTLLETVGSPALRLLFDTGNGIAYGYRAHELLTRVVDHVDHVHVKDAQGPADAPVYTSPGAGGARVADCLRLLLARGYRGTWSIEPHLAIRPHQAVTDRASARVRWEHDDRVDARARCEGFLASGLALERLVREQVLPAVSGWTTAPGGIRWEGPEP